MQWINIVCTWKYTQGNSTDSPNSIYRIKRVHSLHSVHHRFRHTELISALQYKWIHETIHQRGIWIFSLINEGDAAINLYRVARIRHFFHFANWVQRGKKLHYLFPKKWNAYARLLFCCYGTEYTEQPIDFKWTKSVRFFFVIGFLQKVSQFSFIVFHFS